LIEQAGAEPRISVQPGARVSIFDRCGTPDVPVRVVVIEVRPRDGPEGGDPIATLIVERTEKRAPPGSWDRSTLTLRYRVVAGPRDTRIRGSRFDASHVPGRGVVGLTSDDPGRGALFLDLPGLEGNRIGTYLMDAVVRWARGWPEADVATVRLLAGQAHDGNRERRNRFYEQFGLVFDWDDDERRSGRSRPMKAGDLTPTEAWKRNITELPFIDWIHRVQDRQAELQRRAVLAELRVERQGEWIRAESGRAGRVRRILVGGALVAGAVVGFLLGAGPGAPPWAAAGVPTPASADERAPVHRRSGHLGTVSAPTSPTPSRRAGQV
jgi:GNAT superfamily N-acetyltransferase